MEGQRQSERNNYYKSNKPHDDGNCRSDIQRVIKEFREDQDGGDLDAAAYARDLDYRTHRNESEKNDDIGEPEWRGGRECSKNKEETEGYESPFYNRPKKQPAHKAVLPRRCETTGEGVQ
jgi:hypothetical protein